MDLSILRLTHLIFKSMLALYVCQSGLTRQVVAYQTLDLEGQLVEKCCQIGRERAIESARFNCKVSARDALSNVLAQTTDRAKQLLALSAEKYLTRQQFIDQCELVLESCCLAHHRTRNCDSGKQFAKSGSACMDVELSKEATVATESFNDCCMSCSLGILAAKNPAQQNASSTTINNNNNNNNGGQLWAATLSSPSTATTTTATTGTSQASLNERCKLISPLANSMAGQLYEQTYTECCLENLPKISSALIDSSAPIDCSRAANACSQRCLPAGTLDPQLHRRIYQDRCDCFSGYKLASDGFTCLDVDECKLNLHTCNKNSEVCDNTRGSYKCLARTMQLLPISGSWHLQQRLQQQSNGGSFVFT